MAKPKKPMKKPVYDRIRVRYDGDGAEATIEYTNDVDSIMTMIVGVFKEAVGDKLTEQHILDIREKFTDKVQDMTEQAIKSGYATFHRIYFDDNTDIMPWINIEKLKKNEK
jgi:hypothetical protein